MEVWKPLRNFPSYNGSSEGRIMNVRTQKILRPRQDEHGYLKVNLYKNNRRYTVRVGKLIAETFLGEHPGMDVSYRDRDPANVRADNLEWCTRSELITEAYRRGSKRPYQSIPVRALETNIVYDSIRACARDIGCDRLYICQQLSGERENVKGLHFKRENFIT